MLQLIAGYLLSGKNIKPGESFGFGSWTLRLDGNDRELRISEYVTSTDSFTDGAEFSLKLWSDQEGVCKKIGSTCNRPLINQLVVVSDGVLDENLDVQGVRYSSPEHMSGWWLTTMRYGGDTKSLRTEHVIHVIAKRPELAKYLGLPVGYRFNTADGSIVFDQTVAADV